MDSQDSQTGSGECASSTRLHKGALNLSVVSGIVPHWTSSVWRVSACNLVNGTGTLDPAKAPQTASYEFVFAEVGAHLDGFRSKNCNQWTQKVLLPALWRRFQDSQLILWRLPGFWTVCCVELRLLVHQKCISDFRRCKMVASISSG